MVIRLRYLEHPHRKFRTRNVEFVTTASDLVTMPGDAATMVDGHSGEVLVEEAEDLDAAVRIQELQLPAVGQVGLLVTCYVSYLAVYLS